MKNPGRIGTLIWCIIVWLVGIGPVILELLRPDPILIDPIFGLAIATPPSPLALLFARTLNAGVIGIGLLGILCGLAWHQLRLPSKGLWLWLGVIGLSTALCLSAFFGIRPEFRIQVLYLPITATALYLVPPVSSSWLVRNVRIILIIQVFGSLAAAVLAPTWAFEMPYVGMIPGLSGRLHGIVPWGANLLGPLTLVLLTLEHLQPSPGLWTWIVKTCAFIVLVLSQSKTAWLAAVVVVCIHTATGSRGARRMSLKALVGATLLAGSIVLGAAYLFVPARGLGDNLDGLLTFTGRTGIWAYVISLWKLNPLFGYGPYLFATDDVTRLAAASVSGWAPRHSHNQFVQFLGESGLLGLIGLLQYVITMGVLSFRQASVTRWVSVTLFLIMMIHAMTEVPMRNYDVDGDFFFHLVLFGLLLQWERTAWSSAPASADRPTWALLAVERPPQPGVVIE